jgi:hypothetical protein
MKNEYNILDEYVHNLPNSLVWNGSQIDDHDGQIDMKIVGEVCTAYTDGGVEPDQLAPWVCVRACVCCVFYVVCVLTCIPILCICDTHTHTHAYLR